MAGGSRAYLALIVLSMVFNYTSARAWSRGVRGPSSAIGVGANLASIAYYKYAGFLVANFEQLTGVEVGLGTIVLPLAISFFTFQQIAYLVDA